MSQRTGNLQFDGFLVVQSAYKTFLAQLNFSFFCEIFFSIFWKKFFQKSNFFFSKNRKFELFQKYVIYRLGLSNLKIWRANF